MGLDITFFNQNTNKEAGLHYNYHGIHILRDYALSMLGIEAGKEDDPEARKEFPNLIWHNDAEGYYVGFLPVDCTTSDGWHPWDEKSQLWVGSVEGLYKELIRVQAHMLKNEFKGDAREILEEFLTAFAKIDFDLEENVRYVGIIFS